MVKKAPDDLVPRRVGLAVATPLPKAATTAAATAIALGRFRGTEWSERDETLNRVLAGLKKQWGHTW